MTKHAAETIVIEPTVFCIVCSKQIEHCEGLHGEWKHTDTGYEACSGPDGNIFARPEGFERMVERLAEEKQARAEGRLASKKPEPGSRSPHGTASRYRQGCKCPMCRDAKSHAERERVRRRKLEMTPTPREGHVAGRVLSGAIAGRK